MVHSIYYANNKCQEQNTIKEMAFTRKITPQSCNSIIVLARDASTVIHPPTDHSHTPDPIQAKVDEFKNTCKKRAREETTPVSQIHKQQSVKYSLKHNDVSFLPSYSSIDSSFYRERLKYCPK
ncbi:unnamed protein product [Didymodactylos carnosus]|uniref:FLYWCH-type domain-containing protein n=1 Tax=Didymodactylos carnosus TaxID=1234261 RepID=A0A814FB71_9BILA|nr:unnamed protein product [Didymodactylos carnosus]CAF3753432.1 unnamed protein product [Didymodactylos carnosus]